jgi:ATP-binding cassette subfamily C protein
MFFLEALTESLRVSEGELNLFLVPRAGREPSGERVFLAVLRPGDPVSPEGPVTHDGTEYAPAVVASGDALALPEASRPKEWLRFLCEAVSRIAQARVEASAFSELAAKLLDLERTKKLERGARLAADRALTESALQRKLDVLRRLGGVKAGATGGKAGDSLELALRRIAGDYRLPLRDKQLGELQKCDGPSPRERAQNFAAAVNWRARAVHLPPGFRTLSARPLLAFGQADGAPYVLYLKGGGSTCWDPALGGEPRPLSADWAESLSSEALCFYEPFPAGKKDRKILLRFIFATAKPALATVFLVGLAAALLGLVMPVATEYVTGKIIPTANLPELWQLAGLLVVLTACQIVLGVVPALIMLLFGTQQYERFQAAVFDHILRLPVANFQICDSGDLTQRVLGASRVQQAVFQIISGQFLGSVFSLFSLAMMFYYSPTLAWVGTAAVGLYAGLYFLLAGINLRPLAFQAAASGRVSGLMKQFFDGLGKIRGAGAEQQIISRFLDDFSPMARHNFVIARNGAMLGVVTTIFPMLISVLFYGLAGGWLDENLPLPVFLAFMAAFQNFQGGIMGLSSGCWSLLAIEPEIQRLMPLLEAEPEDTGERSPPGALDGSLEVAHVTFRYAADGPPVLDDVSFRAEPGEFVAVVGPSGSGKSTLLRLLLGFERPEKGGIYYSGKDLATLDLRAVRRQMGVILQNSKILPGSILENITAGAGHSLDDAWRALELAALAEEVRAMPMGIQTLVSADTLSGGQQQRILIARALLGSPRIVIMDESTSALDNRTQAAVSRNMEQLRMTRLVIAHRLSTIVQADRIYVLEKGRVCQSGSYGELCAEGGLFKRLVERQLE